VKQARLDERLEKNREGTVTDDEAAELDAYERFEHVVRLLKPLLQASLMASMLAAGRAPIHQLTTRPPQPSVPRMEAPLHPMRLAWQLAVSCQAMAQTFDLQGVEAQRRWDTLAAILTPSGTEPHWRRRPSVFDQLCGWTRQPLARKDATSEKGNHGPLKAGA
jgi:hypothetical protein